MGLFIKTSGFCRFRQNLQLSTFPNEAGYLLSEWRGVSWLRKEQLNRRSKFMKNATQNLRVLISSRDLKNYPGNEASGFGESR